MWQVMIARLKRTLHQLNPKTFLDCQDINLTSRSSIDMFRHARFIGCTCGHIFYVDKFGDRNVSVLVQQLIDHAHRDRRDHDRTR